MLVLVSVSGDFVWPFLGVGGVSLAVIDALGGVDSDDVVEAAGVGVGTRSGSVFAIAGVSSLVVPGGEQGITLFWLGSVGWPINLGVPVAL